MKAIGYLKKALDMGVKEFMPQWQALSAEDQADLLNDARADAKASGVELEDADVDGKTEAAAA